MSDPVHVYIAGPYTAPDPETNTHRALQVATEILALGGYPFVPHLSHFWHQRHPADYEVWMDYDMAWLSKCDVLYRLVGASPGADREVETAMRLDIPVVFEGAKGSGWGELVYRITGGNSELPPRRPHG